MNAFAHSWDDERVWLCPPVSLVVPAVKHLLASNSIGVLCCPLWKSSNFWLSLAPDGVHLADFVTDFVIFYPKYFSGKSVKSRMFSGVPKWPTLGLFLDPENSGDGSSLVSISNCTDGGCNKCVF